jgi:hypothetical protein
MLKGQGAIASVSGWKASCRKAANMLGLDEVAVMEPAGRSHMVVTSKPKNKEARETRQTNQPPSLPSFMLSSSTGESHTKVSLAHVLSGNESLTFAVASSKGMLTRPFTWVSGSRYMDDDSHSYFTFQRRSANSNCSSEGLKRPLRLPSVSRTLAKLSFLVAPM